MGNIASFIPQLLIWAVPTVFAIICHEVMHGVVAGWLGDDTAERAGRLTLNPIPHIDPFGTIILPALLIFTHLPVFGYARPVPVNFGRLRDRRLGMILVAAAGPLTNLGLATLSAIALHLCMPYIGRPLGTVIFYPFALMLRASVVVNIVLAVFNLFPLLPLDGGRVVAGILPPSIASRYARLERFGFLILLLLLYTNAVSVVINPIINAVARVLL